MIHKPCDYLTFMTFLKDVLKVNFELILLKGYSHRNKKITSEERYKEAKTPYSKRKGETQKVDPSEMKAYITQGFWFGLKMPSGYALVDNDSSEVGKVLAQCLMKNDVKCVVFKTHNGFQFLFCDATGKIKKQRTEQITLSGTINDYRIAPNGYTVLPTTNIPERSIFIPDAIELDDIPDVFLPVRGKKNDEGDELCLPISEGQRNSTLLAHACRLNNYQTMYRMDFDTATVLHQINNLFVVPTLPPEEVEKIVGSSNRYERPEPFPVAVMQWDTGGTGNITTTYEGNKDTPYFYRYDFLFRTKINGDGERSFVRLANFDAQIVKEVLEDNGVEQMTKYILTGENSGRRLPEIEVPASSFASMTWISLWGTRAVIEPGQGTKDYVRHAIQSRALPQYVTSYAHTGWRKIDEQWTYLTHSGAIGIADITVKLPKEAQRYCLPLDIVVSEREAVQASLSFLTIAKKEITIPLYASMFLSTLTTIMKPMPNFSILSYGVSGSQKSTFAVLLLSHWGEFDINCLNNFGDTSNHLIERAFKLKDALMVVDDYHPEVSKKTSEDKEKVLQKLLRDFSNRTGRGRLNADSTEKERHEPRGLLLVTAEELPRVLSTIARTLVVEFKRGDVDMKMLTELQNKAHLLPSAMTSWLRWLSLRIDSIRKTFPAEFSALRTKASSNSHHHKLPEQIAFLHYTMTLVAQWMREIGVLNEQGAELLLNISWDTLTGNMGRQSEMVQAEDPVNIFMETLETLIIQGKVLIKNRLTNQDPVGNFGADFIGYYDDDLTWLYLNPMGTWNAIKRYQDAQGTHFPMSKNTLYKMLKNKGLTNPEEDKPTTVVKVRDEGALKSHRVLELKITDRLKEAMLSVSLYLKTQNIMRGGQ